MQKLILLHRSQTAPNAFYSTMLLQSFPFLLRDQNYAVSKAEAVGRLIQLIGGNYHADSSRSIPKIRLRLGEERQIAEHSTTQIVCISQSGFPLGRTHSSRVSSRPVRAFFHLLLLPVTRIENLVSRDVFRVFFRNMQMFMPPKGGGKKV